jgi:hypothetical protein
MFLYDAILPIKSIFQNFSPGIKLEEPSRLFVNVNRLATVSRLVDSNVDTLTVCSNQLTYLLDRQAPSSLASP